MERKIIASNEYVATPGDWDRAFSAYYQRKYPESVPQGALQSNVPLVDKNNTGTLLDPYSSSTPLHSEINTPIECLNELYYQCPAFFMSNNPPAKSIDEKLSVVIDAIKSGELELSGEALSLFKVAAGQFSSLSEFLE